MASAADERPCRWCGGTLGARPGPGRPKEFCRPACRQRDYEARRRAADHGLGEDEIVVRRVALQALQDRLFILQAAVDDVAADLSGRPTNNDYRAALTHLLTAARPLKTMWIEPA